MIPVNLLPHLDSFGQTGWPHELFSTSFCPLSLVQEPENGRHGDNKRINKTKQGLLGTRTKRREVGRCFFMCVFVFCTLKYTKVVG